MQLPAGQSKAQKKYVSCTEVMRMPANISTGVSLTISKSRQLRLRSLCAALASTSLITHRALLHGVIASTSYLRAHHYGELYLPSPLSRLTLLALVHIVVMQSYHDVARSKFQDSPIPAFRAKAADMLEYSRAPPVPEIEHDTSASQSLIDVDSPHISSVPSDFDTQSIKTDTQAERIEHEAQDAQIKAEKEAEELKKKAQKAKNEAKEKAGLAGKRVKDNADNPVVLGNALLVGLGGLGLGWFAYKKYSVGEFNWRLGGILAGAVGLFAAADIYVSKYVSLLNHDCSVVERLQLLTCHKASFSRSTHRRNKVNSIGT